MEKKDDHKTTEEKETAEELLRKIQKLEADHAHLNHHISNLLLLLINNNNNFNFNFNNNNSNHNHNQSDRGRPSARGKSIREHTAVNGSLSGTKWQKIFMVGCTAAEALGKTAPDIIIEPRYSELATVIIQRAVRGETWSGQFPVRTKYGEKFSVITTLSPCRDENGTTFGVTCVCADARPFRESWPQSSLSVPHRISSGHDPHQPPQAAIVSKISNLLKNQTGFHKLKMKTGDINMDHDFDFAPASSTGKHFIGEPTTDSTEGSENKPSLQKVLSQKAEAWMCKKGISWPWKGNANRDSSDLRSHFGWPWLHNDQEQESGPQTSSSDSLKPYDSPSNTKEAPGSSSSYSCGTSSSWSTNSNSTYKTDIHIENLDVQISWDDLILQEQIGQAAGPMEVEA